MARTRSQIKTIVDSYTGRGTEKATLIETLCDEALRVALDHQPFFDASASYDIVITELATSVLLTDDISDLHNVVDARIVQTDGKLNRPLPLRGRFWFDNNVVNAEDNHVGWPYNGLYDKPYIYLDRPAESNLTLRVRATTYQSFTDDNTVCPIEVLSVFVTQYVTAFLFLSIEQEQQYTFWRNICLGKRFDEGKVGGTLLSAINTDKSAWMHYYQSERRGNYGRGHGALGNLGGVAVQNLVDGHEDYGNIQLWFDPR